jgi:hypothetical protein
MNSLLSSHFSGKIFDDNFDDNVEGLLKYSQALLKCSTSALITVGENLLKIKAKVGKEFPQLIDAEGFARYDINKLIKLFEYFGDENPNLLEVGPLVLLRLCASNCEDGRKELHNRLENSDEPITQQEVDEIRIAHKPPSKPRATSKNTASMVGNQQGGVAIFRMEVKEPVLASQCDDSFKQSGGTFDSWMRQLLSSFGLVGELANATLGKNISHVSDIEELRTTLESQNLLVESKNLLVSDEEELAVPSNPYGQVSDFSSGFGSEFDSELPEPVQECIASLLQLDEQLAQYTGSTSSHTMMRRICLDDRREIEEQLQFLCKEFDLDYQSLIVDKRIENRLVMFS